MSKEAMKLALEALEELTDTEQTYEALERGDAAITALREALAEHPAPAAPMLSLRDTLERPAYTHALALKNLRDALELVLRWVDDWCETGPETGFSLVEEKDNAALAAPVQEPIGYAVPTFDFDNSVIKKVHYAGTVPLYTTPQAQLAQQEPVRLQCTTCGTVYADGVPPQVAQPKREWVGLTDDELADLWYKQSLDWMEFARAIEAKLMEKNT